jgi:hypothetical protein
MDTGETFLKKRNYMISFKTHASTIHRISGTIFRRMKGRRGNYARVWGRERGPVIHVVFHLHYRVFPLVS